VPQSAEDGEIGISAGLRADTEAGAMTLSQGERLRAQAATKK
jgi:hypothetical protein